jgi:hypothetical protein
MSDRRSSNRPILGERHSRRRDRRGAHRYLTRGTPAVLGWAGGDRFTTTPAILIDISMGGCSAWVETFPPRGIPIWLCLGGESPSPWLKASVVATIKSGCLSWTRRRVRIRFLESCTYELFKQAVDGFSRELRLEDLAYEGFKGRYWR